jgi:hypothetical protein
MVNAIILCSIRFYLVCFSDVGFVAILEKGWTGRSFHHIDLQSLHGRENIVHQLNARFLKKLEFRFVCSRELKMYSSVHPKHKILGRLGKARVCHMDPETQRKKCL